MVNIANAEPANDTLTINGLDGDDAIVASGLAANAIKLVIDGGAGNDVLVGGAGDDTLLRRRRRRRARSAGPGRTSSTAVPGTTS